METNRWPHSVPGGDVLRAGATGQSTRSQDDRLAQSVRFGIARHSSITMPNGHRSEAHAICHLEVSSLVVRAGPGPVANVPWADLLASPPPCTPVRPCLICLEPAQSSAYTCTWGPACCCARWVGLPHGYPVALRGGPRLGQHPSSPHVFRGEFCLQGGTGRSAHCVHTAC